MKTSTTKEKTLDDALIDLYISLKIQENKEKFDENKIIAERNKLSKFNSFIVIEYIKSIINIVVDTKVKDQLESFFTNYNSQNQDFEKKLESSDLLYQIEENIENLNSTIRSNNPNDYEDLLRKLESDIRNHIKVQHQFRIYCENLKNKIEELEKNKADCKKAIATLQEKLNKCNTSNEFVERKEKEINYLNSEIQNLKVILNSYQNQNTKIMELETQLRMQKMKYNKKMKNLEEMYLNQIDLLNKKIVIYERVNYTSNRKRVRNSIDNSNNLHFLKQDVNKFILDDSDNSFLSANDKIKKFKQINNNIEISDNESDDCGNLTKKIEIYKQQIEKKLENFNYNNRANKLTMYNSNNDTNSISKEITNYTIDKKTDSINRENFNKKDSSAIKNKKYNKCATTIKKEINELSDEENNEGMRLHNLNEYKNNDDFVKYRTFKNDDNSFKDDSNPQISNKVFNNNQKNPFEIRTLKEARLDQNLKNYIKKNLKKNFNMTNQPGHHRSQSMNVLY